jgi:hypothetical protein
MELEPLLQHSLNQYRQLLEQLDDIDRMLKTGRAASIGGVLECWTQLCNATRQTDDRIGELGRQDPEAPRSAPSFAARQALMEDVAERCGELFGQAHTHQALIRDELTHLRGGRRAMSGYKQAPAGAGNRIGTSY